MTDEQHDPMTPLGPPEQRINDGQLSPGLSADALVHLHDADEFDTDVLVIGSGMGGGTIAHALRDSGKRVLVVERGGFLPREPQNRDLDEVHLKGRYKNAGPWYDGRTGKPFHPGAYYWVGGNTRFYGASLPRFRASDFTEVEHMGGRSRAWPFTYEDLEPFYCEAERLFAVRGQTDEDPTEPKHSTPYPHPPLAHEPTVERLARSLRRQGLHPFHTPNALDIRSPTDRAAVATADGSPDDTGIKSDAENRLIVPALNSGSVRLMVRTEVTRLITADDGRSVVAAEARHEGRIVRINAHRFVLAAGAVNSAALLLRSANRQHPRGLGNSSDQVGRNYMVHNNTFFLGLNPLGRNDTHWQKTLGLNDWYEAGPDNRFPLGNLQMLGKLRAPMLKPARPWAPMWSLDLVSARSIDIFLTSEDLASPENRVRVEGDRIMIDWVPNNLEAHAELVRRVTRVVRRSGYPLIFTRQMGIETNSHMCGTAVAGHDPASSVLNPDCRSHDIENLWLADSSFFPSSAALNPALTVSANALRVAQHVISDL
jgi:choline dehydrogenase-like flavoprotein